MVKINVNLTEKEEQIVDAIKEKFGLKDRNQAVSAILKWYEEHELEPKFCSELVVELEKARKCSKFVKVRDFSEEFSK